MSNVDRDQNKMGFLPQQIRIKMTKAMIESGRWAHIPPDKRAAIWPIVRPWVRITEEGFMEPFYDSDWYSKTMAFRNFIVYLCELYDEGERFL